MIISGGQTGIDQIALSVARELGMDTGGWAPKGWLTENGPAKSLLHGYGLKEHERSGYPARTAANVRDADITLIFCDKIGPGTALTVKMCKQYRKPFMINPSATDIGQLRSARIINIAGTRGSKLSNQSLYRERIRSCLLAIKHPEVQKSAGSV